MHPPLTSDREWYACDQPGNRVTGLTRYFLGCMGCMNELRLLADAEPVRTITWEGSLEVTTLRGLRYGDYTARQLITTFDEISPTGVGDVQS